MWAGGCLIYLDESLLPVFDAARVFQSAQPIVADVVLLLAQQQSPTSVFFTFFIPPSLRRNCLCICDPPAPSPHLLKLTQSNPRCHSNCPLSRRWDLGWCTGLTSSAGKKMKFYFSYLKPPLSYSYPRKSKRGVKAAGVGLWAPLISIRMQVWCKRQPTCDWVSRDSSLTLFFPTLFKRTTSTWLTNGRVLCVLWRLPSFC